MRLRNPSAGMAAALLSTLAGPPQAAAQTRIGGEFLVNTYTTGIQRYGVVAARPDGDFVVIWSSYGQDGSGIGVFGQRFDRGGTPLAVEFRVNTYTTSDQMFPSAAMDAQGNFVVVWDNFARDGSGFGVFGQRFSATGAPIGADFQVNTYTTGNQVYPAVGVSAGGAFVVAWTSAYGVGVDGISAQRFDASGSRIGEQFLVNSDSAGGDTRPAVSVLESGFVVAWTGYGNGDPSATGIVARRFDAAGVPLGAQFLVNTTTQDRQLAPALAATGDEGFVVSWTGRDATIYGIFAQRFDLAGNRRGNELKVDTFATNQFRPSVAADRRGHFGVVWGADAQDVSGGAVVARRFSAAGAPRGGEFIVNTYTTGIQTVTRRPSAIATDQWGNFVVTWHGPGDGSFYGILAQRFGGLRPAALRVDAAAGPQSNGNGVFEPGEQVTLNPGWLNFNGASLTVGGDLTAFTGPAGATYVIVDPTASYGTVANGDTTGCSGDCYALSILNTSTRPVLHWDATADETLTPEAQHGQSNRWRLHVGASFSDVPADNLFYRYVETLLHHGVTGGCSETAYCPSQATTREQMAAFVLVAKEGPGFSPPACTTPVFTDVPANNPFCRFIEELFRRGVVGGCAANLYCPASPVTREQMAVFVLRTLDPSLDPPKCTIPVFDDVPADSPFCRWIEELVRREVVSGCAANLYCPTSPVTREQMGVFLSVTFGLVLYGP